MTVLLTGHLVSDEHDLAGKKAAGTNQECLAGAVHSMDGTTAVHARTERTGLGI